MQLFTHQPHDHWLCVVLLAYGSIGRAQVDQFVLGLVDLVELPFLLGMAARMMFIPVTERAVERLHATARRLFSVAPNAGAVHLAFHSMHGDLRALLESSPESLTHFARLCREVQNPLKAVMAMGLRFHPTVQKTFQDYGRQHSGRGYAKY